MQINSATTSHVVPVARTTASKTSGNVSPTSNDEAVLNTSADTFAGYVHDASNMPEVRSEVVDSFKSRIASGNYPTQDTLSGLADQIGGGILAAANSGASYPGSE